ncbi:MAG: MFS transporter [Betaproteobacteria bacterium]|nr:MFS transporter [Betaproteobacteria bacterium]
MNTAAASAATAPQSFKDVWLVSAGHALTHWYPATFYLLLPLIGKELGLSYTEIGLIITVQQMAGAISNIPGGIVVDIIGGKGYLMATSLFWVGFPYALMSITHSFWMLLACETLVGIGNNIWHPAAIPMLAYRYPERKGLVLSFHGMGGNLGEALAPFVIGALLGWLSWRTVVVINVVPGLVMATLILVLLGTLTMTRKGDDAINAGGEMRGVKNYLRDFASLLKNKALMLVSISTAFRGMTQVGLLTFLPVYLAYELNFSPFVVGACLTVLQVAGFAAGPVGGHLSDKIGRKRVISSSMMLTAVMIVGLALAGRSIAFVIFVALVGFFLYATRPVLQAWVVESTPKNLAGTGVGLQFGISAIGGGIAPVVFGMIADAYSIYIGFYFLAGTIVVANFLIFLVPNGEATQAKPVGSSKSDRLPARSITPH